MEHSSDRSHLQDIRADYVVLQVVEGRGWRLGRAMHGPSGRKSQASSTAPGHKLPGVHSTADPRRWRLQRCLMPLKLRLWNSCFLQTPSFVVMRPARSPSEKTLLHFEADMLPFAGCRIRRQPVSHKQCNVVDSWGKCSYKICDPFPARQSSSALSGFCQEKEKAKLRSSARQVLGQPRNGLTKS